jgi:hypothetical protein
MKALHEPSDDKDAVDHHSCLLQALTRETPSAHTKELEKRFNLTRTNALAPQ